MIGLERVELGKSSELLSQQYVLGIASGNLRCPWKNRSGTTAAAVPLSLAPKWNSLPVLAHYPSLQSLEYSTREDVCTLTVWIFDIVKPR